MNVKCDDEYGSKLEIKCSLSQLSVFWRRFLTTGTRQPLRVSELESGGFRPVIAVVRIIWGNSIIRLNYIKDQGSFQVVSPNMSEAWDDEGNGGLSETHDDD